MRQLIAIAVLLGLGLFAAGAGETAAPKAGNAPVDQLIEQLGNRDFKVRETAGKEILARGTNVLPALQKGRRHADPEVRRRVEELIADLERVATLTPKPITLHMDKKPLKAVLAEVAKQTGFKIPTTDALFTGPQAKGLHTFHFDNAPFWETFDKICEAGGLSLQFNTNDDSLHLASTSNQTPFRSYEGAFKVMATGFNYQRNNQFGQVPRVPYQPGQQAYESLQVNLMVASEPRIPITKVGPVKLTYAEDEEKCSMLANGNANYYPWGGMVFYNNGNQRSYFQQTNATLAWPTKSSRTVRVMRGIIPVTILAEQRPTVVTDQILQSKGKKFQVGSATFNIDDVTTLAGKQQEIKISFNETSSDNPYDYSRIQSLQQRLELQDDKGRKLASYVRFFNFNSPTSAQFSIATQGGANSKLGPPAKLIYQVWVQMEHEVKFELKDLPLP